MTQISETRIVLATPDSIEIATVDIRTSELVPLIGARKTIKIVAERVLVDASISAPSANMHVLADTIQSQDGMRLEVSGAAGASASQSAPPKPGLDQTQPRPDGANGKPGDDAGSIELVARLLEGPLELRASGGSGGRAQPGGNGADGSNGVNRPEKHRKKPYLGGGGPGGDGKPGGDAGRAGVPGQSGNGGEISVWIANGSENISSDVAGGPLVPASSHGQPGKGGAKGRGGLSELCQWNSGGLDSPPFLDCQWHGRHPDGNPGADGSAAPNAPSTRPAGTPGNVNIATNLTHHARPVAIRALRLLTLEAERRHVLQDFEGASSLAQWLFRLNRSASVPSIEIRSRTAAILARLETGTPATGTSGAVVPLASFDAHMDAIEDLLKSQSRAADYVARLQGAADDSAEMAAAIAHVRAAAVRAEAEVHERLSEIVSERADIVQKLNQLTDGWQALWGEVMDADHEFQTEVARRAGNGCEFLDAAISAASVVTAVASGGASILGAVASGAHFIEQISADVGDQQDYAEVVGWANSRKTSLEGVAKGAEGLRANAAKLKEHLGGDKLTPPNDTIRMAMTRDDFNAMIEPYLEIAEARNLRALMERFFTFVETRNNLIVAHDQLIVEAAAQRARLAAAKSRLEEIVAHERGETLIGYEDAYEAAMWTELETRKRLLEVIVSANTSYEHFTLTTRQLKIGSSRKEELEAEYARLRQAMLEATRIAQPLETILRVTRETHPKAFEEIGAGASATIELIFPDVTTRYDERATSVGVRLMPYESKQDAVVEVSGRIVLLGLSVFQTEKGESVVARVPERAALVTASPNMTYERVAAARNLTGVSQNVVGVSPYGLWRLRLDGIGRAIEAIEAMEFVFVGTAGTSSDLEVLIKEEFGSAENVGSGAEIAELERGLLSREIVTAQ